MSTRSYIQQSVSNSQPATGTIGDEWFNPSANTYYKFFALGGTTPTWTPIGSFANSVLTVGNASSILDTAGSNFKLGYRQLPQNAQSGNYTVALLDDGKHIFCTGGSTATITIPTSSVVPWTVGTVITMVNNHSGSVAITSSATLQLVLSTTGNRTLASKGMASFLYVAPDLWWVSGAGVT